MATVQQLEKLHQIQRIFYAENTLEAAVAGDRVARLIAKTEQLLRQRAFLRDERRRLRISTEKIEERKNALKTMQRVDWIPDKIASSSIDRHIMINIGGLMYEAPVVVLCRDPNSLLAQLCSANPPVLSDPEGGFYYFDRDWWLFRYILTFLRDGTLPNDRNLLSQLYREAVFWNLLQLQRAIEEEKLHLTSKITLNEDITTAKDNSSNPSSNSNNKTSLEWWRKLPSWWQAVDEAKEKEKVDADTKKKKADWWTDTVYKGNEFLKKEELENITPTTYTWEQTLKRNDSNYFNATRTWY